MCGIAGYINIHQSSTSPATLRRMMDVIAHRGPDGQGVYEDETAHLGHRRLSIIDLGGGHQPMSNETGSVWITYNGEIFNHADLRPELERAGHRYTTRCDTETIVHAYEEYGVDCATKFRGMFAFAIWDAERQRLFCVRDRLGVKPFYYYSNSRLFAFASEIKALLQHPEISAEFEEQLLAEYLALGYTSGDRTLFRGIRKLMPGHTLVVDAQTGSVEIRRYWDVPEAGELEHKSDDEWIRECRTRLEEAVRTRLMSDVPLGMFLSGGVDSSAIAALMKRLRTEPVKTFAVGYEERVYSELSYARTVSEAIGTDHHEVVIGMEDFFNALPRLVWHEDEPISWPSSVSLYFVSRLASEHVKVVLTGEGSDELFAGYHRYQHYLFNRRWADAYRFVPGPLRTGLRKFLAASRLLSADSRRKLQHTFLGREGTIESLQLDNFYAAFSRDELQTMHARGDAYSAYVRYWNSRHGSVLSQMLYADQKTYLVELLMKQDQMSMASSIESRVPFLDHPFVEFAARVPDHLKIRNGAGKYIVKRAVEDVLPHDIIYRKKMGFPTPLRQWLLDDRAEPLFALLLDRKRLLAEYIDLEFVADLIGRQRSGIEDATDRIWRLLNLQLWGDLFFTGRAREHSEGLLRKPAPVSV
ncbi:MAG TPA: asparagine synthase (glutamine-hydrolyzing) [Bryobacteraceae bacterium]|jgi:asparagine synthase (glutamine-hydrolysing)|nr:asparagine synthase (glutamine-hydrolyzing) [Bryobacteraceae bacterium]